MIFFFYGTDRERILARARGTFEALQNKKPDATFVLFDADNFSLNELEAITGSQGLFEHKIVAKLSDVLTNKEIADDILKALPAMKESENIIVWSEGTMLKAPLDKIKKYAEKTEEFLLKSQIKKNEFNIFALSDALGAKDRKHLWALLIAALRGGSAPEEIHGTLWWQLKTIMIVRKSKIAEEAGLKPFPYSKAKSFSKNWSDDELSSALTSLVSMYHQAHRGECDLSISLERFALGVM